MRKYIVGFIAGMLFASSVSAYAATTVVGKKVQGQTPVVVNGKLLDNGIVIDGKSYAPVRKIGEAAGYSVDFNGRQINLNKVVKVDGKFYTGTDEIDKRISELEDGIPRLQQEMDRINDQITRSEAVLSDPESRQSDKDIAASVLNTNQGLLVKYNDSKQARENELAELEAQRAELEAQ